MQIQVLIQMLVMTLCSRCLVRESSPIAALLLADLFHWPSPAWEMASDLLVDFQVNLSQLPCISHGLGAWRYRRVRLQMVGWSGQGNQGMHASPPPPTHPCMRVRALVTVRCVQPLPLDLTAASNAVCCDNICEKPTGFPSLSLWFFLPVCLLWVIEGIEKSG